MPNTHALPQIFISYAREDYARVRQLYVRLKGAGYKPWMDKVDLPKGADFAKAIPKVLRKSDLFIVCLSSRSVSKRSFIQREINLALDIWEEKLDDDLYIFPMRLEACIAPDRPQAVITAPPAATPTQPDRAVLPKPYIENLNSLPGVCGKAQHAIMPANKNGCAPRPNHIADKRWRAVAMNCWRPELIHRLFANKPGGGRG